MPVVNLSPGDQVLVDDYNALAYEINRIYSNKAVGLAYLTSNLIYQETIPGGGYPGGQTFVLSPEPRFDDYLVVTIKRGANDNVLLKGSEWSFGDGSVTGVTLTNGGGGYVLNEILYLDGANYETQATVRVTGVSPATSQAVSAITLANPAVFTVPNTGIYSNGDTVTVDSGDLTVIDQTITSITQSAVAVITVADTSSYSSGDVLSIAGGDMVELDGDFTISVTGPTTFSMVSILSQR